MIKKALYTIINKWINVYNYIFIFDIQICLNVCVTALPVPLTLSAGTPYMSVCIRCCECRNVYKFVTAQQSWGFNPDHSDGRIQQCWNSARTVFSTLPFWRNKPKTYIDVFGLLYVCEGLYLLPFQEYTMLCMLCGKAEDSISVMPDDPRQSAPLFWRGKTQDRASGAYTQFRPCWAPEAVLNRWPILIPLCVCVFGNLPKMDPALTGTIRSMNGGCFLAFSLRRTRRMLWSMVLIQSDQNESCKLNILYVFRTKPPAHPRFQHSC